MTPIRQNHDGEEKGTLLIFSWFPLKKEKRPLFSGLLDIPGEVFLGTRNRNGKGFSL